jgi:thiamine transport system permease protein
MTRSILPSAAAFGFIALAIVAGFVPVVFLGIEEGVSRGGLVDAYVLQIIRFTVLQALLSTALSVGLAIPVARAFFRREFPGRLLLLRLFALPLALPAIVVILGIVEIYGRTGWISAATGYKLDIYGLAGILLAHVFFNLPLATRMLLQRLDAISPETWRLAAQLGLPPRQRFRLIEWPALGLAIPGTASLIFLLCAASFAVVLTLGGGPSGTTLEVAIFQALRFDYDPARATVLALAQLILCGTFVLYAGRHARAAYDWPTLRRARRPLEADTPAAWARDMLVLVVSAIFVALPILATIVAGVAADFEAIALLHAGATSIVIAAGASLLSLFLSWPLSLALAHVSQRGALSLLNLTTLLPLMIPPAVLATGWFIIASRLGVPLAAAPFMVVAMNALMALPFAVGVLGPAVRLAAAQNNRLCASLGLAGWSRLRIVDLPILRAPLGLAAALAFIVSLGDLTAITLFGSQDLVTLPALIYSQMGSYRINAAAGSALVLALLSLALISFFEKLGSRR